MMSEVTSCLLLCRGPVRRSVFHCVRRTQRAPDRGAARSQGARTARNGGCCFYERQPAPECHRPAVL
ncbi:unnamed protein product [Staurois parvus]|uniref:Uncharacterized protein n=1 Tax=Staurois parvus TaxID=386267 RepID=A0ABN9EJM6_9NEOB|nr:unnamed protein product [Staurois parvus]